MTDKASRGVDAKVNHCMWDLMDYAAKCKPQIVIMESVRPAYVMGREMMTALRARLEEGSGRRYGLWHIYQNAIDLGGAAHRPRYFFVASQVPFGVEWPNVRKPLLADVIGDLVPLSMTWQYQPHRTPATWWSRSARNGHKVTDGHVTHHGPYISRALDLMHFNDGEWPEGWAVPKLAKHVWETKLALPESWDYTKDKLIKRDFNMGFTTMVRWTWDKPARVITGAGLYAVMHPRLPRPITHREAARIMGFPDDWRILPLRHVPGIVATYGKGITVQCGKWIGDWARHALDGEPGSVTGEPVGDREWFIQMNPKVHLQSQRSYANMDRVRTI